MRTAHFTRFTAVLLVAAGLAAPAAAGQSQLQNSSGGTTVPTAPTLPSDYVIGPEDVIGVIFWREPDMSGDVPVRPDGMITLPLLREVRAAGLRPEELRELLEKAAIKFFTEPNVSVVVRQINSRKIFIVGEVATPGAYPLTGPRTVMQAIALAGGLNEFADSANITIMRMENGRQRSFKFSYKDVARGKALAQNIALQPGDTIVVP
jgi:polysaccharide export outer membrane protein